MPSLKVFFALAALAWTGPQAALAQANLGAQGGEGQPNRMQQWLVPTPAVETLSHAVLFRPPGEGPFPLAVIAHATTQNVLRRAQMPQPEYRALAARLVARGFAVLVPERPGHGATGGKYLEDQGGCDEADYSRSARATANAIAAAAGFVRKQPFIKPGGMVILGHSAGGWGALPLATEDPGDVAAIIVFAAGRGGRANDFPDRICAPHTLIASAREFGKGARVLVTWLVAANDSYFSPAFSKQLADAFRSAGGKVDFHALPASGGEGHWLAETESGVKLAAGDLDRALKGAASDCCEQAMSLAENPWPDDDVILYDGVCVFCSRWVRFVATRDKANRFRFTAIQSPYGARLAQAFGINPDDPDTNAVVHGGVAYFKSDAALTVLGELPGWGWVGVLRGVPKPLRDAVYGLVAKNRYRIFGKYDECFVPDADMRAKVME